MKFFNKVSLNFIFSVIGFSLSLSLAFTGCASSTLENSTAAQITLPDTQLKEPVQKDFEFVRLTGNLCSLLEIESHDKPEYKGIYELMNAGYPKEVSLEEAVAVANKFAQCRETGRTQPLLRSEEIVASIRKWVCERDAYFDDKKKPCEEFRRIAESGKMPKGSFIEFGGGLQNYRGYNIKAWEIHLRIRLDKHRADLKDVPSYSRLIRLNYISSEPTKDF